MRLLDALLDLSKLEAGKLILELRPCDLAELVREAIAEQVSQIDRKQLLVRLDPPLVQTVVEGDSTRLLQVLRNLLSNAVKFTPEGGAINFHFQGASLLPGGIDSQAVSALRLDVCDGGAGIPEAEFETIFQQFVQSSKTRTGAGGTGLGLSISREIVLAHGGRLSAGPSTLGGACFTMILPVQGPPATPAPPAASVDFSI